MLLLLLLLSLSLCHNRFHTSCPSFDDTTLDIRFMLDAMIRYDEINASDPTFHDTSAAMFPPSELIKLFKSVGVNATSLYTHIHFPIIFFLSFLLKKSMPPCKNMLMYCKWQNMETDCLRLFKVITTDDGFCCVFNALDSEDILKEDSAYVRDKMLTKTGKQTLDCIHIQ